MHLPVVVDFMKPGAQSVQTPLTTERVIVYVQVAQLVSFVNFVQLS